MSGNSRTITLKNDTDNEIKVTVNGKEYLIDSTGVEVSYTRPSSGGGGSVTTYAVTVEDTDNGTVTASVKSASKGSTVTLTVKPDEGYQLDKLTVTDKDGKEISVTEKEDGKYAFTMPASKVSVSAAFTKSEEKPEQIAGFTDVLMTDWFADAVQYAVDNGMMNGTSEMTFHPNGTTTRGMIVTILYRLEKEPAVDNGAGFAMWRRISITLTQSRGRLPTISLPDTMRRNSDRTIRLRENSLRQFFTVTRSTRRST